ncbi:MAG: hypothetical protein Q4G44_10440 [Alcaligenaceae bacterium]|nr:hypothetical protein [Alcaligenaceae bacterium]
MPEPIILPVSSVITDGFGERRNYDLVLNDVFMLLMELVRESIVFEEIHTTYPDGVVSNMKFNEDDKARPLWRYSNLSSHVVFISRIINRTLTEKMREQLRYLYNHGRARLALNEIVEMPDLQADRVLRSLEQNRGKLSNVLAKEMPILKEPGIWLAITEAVSLVFKDDTRIEQQILDRYHPSRPTNI